MKERLNQILYILRILGTILGIGILSFQIYTSIHKFTLPKLSTSFFYDSIIALTIIILAILLQMTAWKLILASIGNNISLSAVYSGFSTSFVSRYIPGTIWGYLARGEWLQREHKVPYSMTNFATIIETAGFLLTNVFIVIQGYLLETKIGYNLVFLFAMIGIGWALINIIIRWKPTRSLFNIKEDQLIHFPILHWISIFALYLVMWYCYGLSLIIFINGMGLQLGYSDYLHLSSIFSLAWFLGFIVLFIPAGLGLREYSLTVLLAAQFGQAKLTFSYIAIGFRFLTLIAELVWVLYGLAKKAHTGLIKSNKISSDRND